MGEYTVEKTQVLFWINRPDGSSLAAHEFADSANDIAAELNRLHTLIQAATDAGFITPDGQVVKVLGTIHRSKDGCLVGHGAKLYSPWWKDDPSDDGPADPDQATKALNWDVSRSNGTIEAARADEAARAALASQGEVEA